MLMEILVLITVDIIKSSEMRPFPRHFEISSVPEGLAHVERKLIPEGGLAPPNSNQEIASWFPTLRV